jgi:hypothetical protein
MATPRSLRSKSKSKSPVPVENQTESQAVAHGIAIRFNDLSPSIDRIMNAGLDEAGQLRAITLFRDSLGVPGDPYRIPYNAIEAGRSVERAPR